LEPDTCEKKMRVWTQKYNNTPGATKLNLWKIFKRMVRNKEHQNQWLLKKKRRVRGAGTTDYSKI